MLHLNTTEILQFNLFKAIQLKKRLTDLEDSMTKTPSNMMPLGTKAPDFNLLDTVSGTSKSLSELKSDIATVIMFICNHCPFVKHLRNGLINLANDYIPKGISFIAISANDASEYPEDAPDKMKVVAQEFGYPFPYLHDESQQTAKAYDAVCTPDFYIFDNNLRCVYRGQFDSSRPESGIPVTGKDIRSALDDILSEKPISVRQRPSLGCNIKWKHQ
jgi:thiol-disulfide isomerase/thioredoxin